MSHVPSCPCLATPHPPSSASVCHEAAQDRRPPGPLLLRGRPAGVDADRAAGRRRRSIRQVEWRAHGGHGVGAGKAPAGHVVLALGDSVPSGHACDCNPFPETSGSLLGSRTGTHVVVDNRAVGGLDTAGLIGQLRAPDVEDAVRRSDVFLVTIGANDFGDRHDEVVHGRCEPREARLCQRRAQFPAGPSGRRARQGSGAAPRTADHGADDGILERLPGRRRRAASLRRGRAAGLAPAGVGPTRSSARCPRMQERTTSTSSAPSSSPAGRHVTDGPGRSHPNAAGHELSLGRCWTPASPA